MSTVQSSADPVREEVLRDGTRVQIRPIHPDNIELERRFRFLETMHSPSPALLKQMTVIKPSTDTAYVALLGTGAQTLEIGVARFSARTDRLDCEFAVTVSDEWQHKGLGTLLMQRLIDVAKARGIKKMHSSDAADNGLMRKFAEHLNFHHVRDPDNATLVLYSVALSGSPEASGMR